MLDAHAVPPRVAPGFNEETYRTANVEDPSPVWDELLDQLNPIDALLNAFGPPVSVASIAAFESPVEVALVVESLEECWILVANGVDQATIRTANDRIGW